MRSARRTLWLGLPVFTLAAWGTSLSLRGAALPARGKLYFALLAGVLALGAWLGLRRWRREPSLSGGVALVPAGSFSERVLAPLAAGLVFWPWLLVELVRDVRLAGRLRGFVPPEARAGSFGLGELSLALASVAAAFTLGTHGLSSYTPVAGKLWAAEAGMAADVQSVIRDEGEAQLDKVRASEPASPAPAAEPPPSTARLEPAAAEAPAPDVEQPRQEARASRHHRRVRGSEPSEPQDPPSEQEATPAAAPPEPSADEASAEATINTLKVTPTPVGQAPSAQPQQADRMEQAMRAMRTVPGRQFGLRSDLGRRQFPSRAAPAPTIVTSSGRTVVHAPPPRPMR